MKKSIIIFLTLILLTSFIIAEEVDPPENADTINNFEKFKEEYEALKAENATKWSQKIELPEFFQGPMKFIFNLEDNEDYQTLYLEDAIVFLMVIFMFFLIIYQALNFVGIVKEGAITVVTAIAISILGSIFGGMTYLSTFYINFVSGAGALASLPIWQKIAGTSGWGTILIYVPIIIAIVIIWLILDSIKVWLHNKNIKLGAEAKATRLKIASDKIKMMSKKEVQ